MTEQPHISESYFQKLTGKPFKVVQFAYLLRDYLLTKLRERAGIGVDAP